MGKRWGKETGGKRLGKETGKRYEKGGREKSRMGERGMRKRV